MGLLPIVSLTKEENRLNYQRWKLGIVALPFLAIFVMEVGFSLFGWLSHGELAAFCALCATVSLSATFIDSSEQEWPGAAVVGF